MKLHIYQSDKGDCLLLEGAQGGRILCDGGMAASMRRVVRAELAKLRKKNETIDAAYISHIDQDHISGVLALLEDELEWRVFDHHKKKRHAGVKQPKVPRPPEIKAIWHNAFSAQLDGAAKPVEDLLAAAAPVLLATRQPEMMEIGEEAYQIATSIPEAIKVSRLAAPKMLGIPLNKLPGIAGPAKLLMVRRTNKAIRIGSMRLTIVGPTRNELTLLQEGWNTWLKNNRDAVDKIDKELKKRMAEFSNALSGPTPIDLGDWNGIPDFKGVTTPNIASLMFMVEENGKQLLLTGDSQQDFIISGLKSTGFMANGHLHLDVHKVQHHASEHNIDEDFLRQVSADHYVFCGNGLHKNPDLGVIQMVYDSRLGPLSKRALAPKAANRKFTMWFSTDGDSQANAHMRAVKKLVQQLVKSSGGKMAAKFNAGASIALTV